MGTIKADTVTGLADPNKVTLPSGDVTNTTFAMGETLTVGSTTATLNFGNTVIANASAGSSTITGEGGSTTTNIQQGLLKAWSKVDGTGTAAVNDSLNISGITDNSTGNYTLAMSNAMGVNTYAQTHGANCGQQQIISATTSAYRLETSNSAGTVSDVSVIGSQISGDLG